MLEKLIIACFVGLAMALIKLASSFLSQRTEKRKQKYREAGLSEEEVQNKEFDRSDKQLFTVGAVLVGIAVIVVVGVLFG